jgi:hypothetical protein
LAAPERHQQVILQKVEVVQVQLFQQLLLLGEAVGVQGELPLVLQVDLVEPRHLAEL